MLQAHEVLDSAPFANDPTNWPINLFIVAVIAVVTFLHFWHAPRRPSQRVEVDPFWDNPREFGRQDVDPYAR